jgi:hypothetical protein
LPAAHGNDDQRIARGQSFRAQIERRVSRLEQKHRVRGALHFGSGEQRRQHRARAPVANGRARHAAAKFTNHGFPPEIERTDGLRKDHRRLASRDGEADDARIIQQTAQARRVLQEPPAARNDDIGPPDRLAHGAQIGPRGHAHAEVARGSGRIAAEHVDRDAGVPPAHFRDDDGQQRFVTQITEAVVARKQNARRHRTRR